MANVAPISYVEAAQLAKVQNYGGLMLEYLGQTGRGKFNTATLNYQKEWNKALPVVAKVPGAVNVKQLVEDGLYGANSRGTVINFIPQQPYPSHRAYQVPTWYAANKGTVDAMKSYSAGVPPSPQPPLPIPYADEAEVTVIESKTAPPIVIVESKEGAAVIQPEPPPLPIDRPYVPPDPAPLDTSRQPAHEVLITPVEPPGPIDRPLTPPGPSEPNAPIVVQAEEKAVAKAVKVTKIENDVVQLPELRVTGLVARGDWPYYAVGVAVVGLGGTLAWWMLRDQPKRKAA